MSIFQVSNRDATTKARAGVLQTAHGPVETPVFMPVGTQGAVKTLDSADVEQMGYRILLGNTYHLLLRPGQDLLTEAGGLHKFMSWPGAILTDSGGYQVFSLATRCVVEEEGVEFQSHVDGSRQALTPESATRFQLAIGADIAMCLDDCPPYPSLREDAERSLERTLRWAKRCREDYQRWLSEKSADGVPQLLFGITQGASFLDLRRDSALRTAELDFPGYAVGGVGLGEEKSLMWDMVEASVNSMPDEKPHYLMGIGQPEDMWDGVERGIDMFDCVLPTRNGRNGQAFTSVGRINVPNATYRKDFGPLDPDCSCLCCRRFSRAYLCHLFRAGELVAPRLVTLHNLTFMIGLLRLIRSSLIHGNFPSEKRKFLQRYTRREPTGVP